MDVDESTQAQDKTLTCTDCQTDFAWSVKEQEFFAEKNFDPPKRCLPCRKKRRAQKKERPGSRGQSARGNSRDNRGNR